MAGGIAVFVGAMVVGVGAFNRRQVERQLSATLGVGRAEQRMAGVPEFVQPMVRTGIERFAKDKGYERIDERVLDEAKGFFGME